MDEKDYYAKKLSAQRLRDVYAIAPPRVQRYLQAETDFVLEHVRLTDAVLELGCGYGRALEPLIGRARMVAGIDNALASLELGLEETAGPPRCYLAAMDAGRLGIADDAFDVVFCIQNGISALKTDRSTLVSEALRVTRPGGTVLFSSYAEAFWPDRLEWFRLQAERGLLGEIDEEATGDGVIVCKDGFRAETVGPGEFAALAATAGIPPEIVEIDGSSVFCVLQV
jgi:SAM-dependent methyltransferase